MRSWRELVRLLLVAALLAGTVAVEDGSQQQAGEEEEEEAADASAADAASLSYLPYPTYTSVPAEYVLTNSTYGYTLAKVAQQGAKAVIFTCVRLEPGDDEEEVLSLVLNFGHSLHNVGLLEHMMMITTDERTWKLLRHRGLPVYLDRSFPRRQAYVETLKPGDTLNSEVDVQKYWWSLRILQTGLRVLYLDPDSVVLTHDLMAPFYKPYDVQGLSDWAEAELHLTGQGMGTHCDLGFQAAERRGAGGAIKGSDPDAAAALEKRVQAMSPCQSTSLFYLQPTDITVRFIQDLVADLVFGAAAKWERVAWNERVVAYLYGMGNDVQLTYRILPVNEFCSMGIYKARVETKMPSDSQVAVHAGAMPGVSGKKRQLMDLDLWYGDAVLAVADGGWADDEEGTPLWVRSIRLLALVALCGTLLLLRQHKRRRRPGMEEKVRGRRPVPV